MQCCIAKKYEETNQVISLVAAAQENILGV